MNGSAVIDAASRHQKTAESDVTVAPPPLWLQCAALISLAEVVIGMIAVIVHPGPVSGAIFPLALGSIWLTAWAAGERR
jgi:hypothetical protein